MNEKELFLRQLEYLVPHLESAGELSVARRARVCFGKGVMSVQTSVSWFQLSSVESARTRQVDRSCRGRRHVVLPSEASHRSPDGQCALLEIPDAAGISDTTVSSM